jgi:hypothetical protein
MKYQLSLENEILRCKSNKIYTWTLRWNCKTLVKDQKRSKQWKEFVRLKDSKI